MKALQRVVWSLIFLVFGVHMVNAEEQGIQVQQRIETDLGEIPRGVEVRWKKMVDWGTCECKWDERAFCKEEKEKRNSQGKDPRTFDGNSDGEDLSTLKQTASERTQEPFKNQL